MSAWIALASLLLTACTNGAPSPGADPEKTACADGEIDDGGLCVPEACGTGTWGTIEGATVFVDGAAAEGGDGSQDAPLRSIQEGVDVAGESGGGVVAVAAGTYLENLDLGGSHDGVEIAGRCAELVVVDGSGGEDDQGAVEMGGNGAEVTLRGLTITGGPYTGLLAWRGTTWVYDAVVAGNAFVGVAALGSGTVVELVRTTISDTQMIDDGSWGRGINVQDGAALRAEACVVTGNHEIGLYASTEGTTVDLVDTTISDTRMVEDGTKGRGLHVQGGATLRAEGCTLSGNHESGVYASDEGTSVELLDTTVADTQMIEDGTWGRGVNVQGGATLRAEGCSVTRNHEAGVVAGSEATAVELVNTTVSDTLMSSDGTGGRGISVQAGAMLWAEDCTVAGNNEVGVFAADEGTAVELVDSTVSDTQMTEGGTLGGGIVVVEGATMGAEGCTVTGNSEVGIFAVNEGTTVELVDSTVSHTEMIGEGIFGRGIVVVEGATLLAQDCEVTGNHEVGVLAGHEGTTVELVDTIVSATRPSEETTVGLGVAVYEGARLAGTGVDASDNHGPGLLSVSDSTLFCTSCTIERNAFAGAAVVSGALELTNSLVSDNQPSGQEGGGLGVFAWDNEDAPPTLRLSGTTVGPHAYAAVWLRNPGSYIIEDNDLSGGEGQAPQDWIQLHGDAVYATGGITAWDEDTQMGLSLQGNTLRDSAGAGLFLDGSAATLLDNTWSRNTIDLVQQRCGSIAEMAAEDTVGVPTIELCPAENRAVAELDFALILVEAALEED